MNLRASRALRSLTSRADVRQARCAEAMELDFERRRGVGWEDHTCSPRGQVEVGHLADAPITPNLNLDSVTDRNGTRRRREYERCRRRRL